MARSDATGMTAYIAFEVGLLTPSQLVGRPNIQPTFRSSIFQTMLRLSKNSGLHPKCLAIQNVKKVGEHPITAGGFGDVWKGTIGDSNKLVCLKIMKVYLNSDVVQLSKVGGTLTSVSLPFDWPA